MDAMENTISDIDRETIQSIAATIRIEDSHFITSYGEVAMSQSGFNSVTDLLEQSPATLLAGKISEVVSKLGEADPKRLNEKTGWLARFTGADLERVVCYEYARKSLDTLIEEAQRHAQHLRDTIQSIEKFILEHDQLVRKLTIELAAGRLYLERNPDAGKPSAGAIQFDNPRERFARRLTNMSALLVSSNMSISQLKLARAQGFDLLDRFNEVSQVLIPMWRHHSLLLVQSKNNPEVFLAANQAHESLMNRLVAMSKA